MTSISAVRANIHWVENLAWEKKAGLVAFIALLYKTEKIIADRCEEQYNQIHIYFTAYIYIPKTAVQAAKIVMITVCAAKIFLHPYISVPLAIVAVTVVVADLVFKENPPLPPSQALEGELHERKNIIWLKPNDLSYDNYSLIIPSVLVHSIFLQLNPTPKELGILTRVCKDWYFAIYSPDNIMKMSSTVTSMRVHEKDYRTLLFRSLPFDEALNLILTKLPAESKQFTTLINSSDSFQMQHLIDLLHTFKSLTHLDVRLNVNSYGTSKDLLILLKKFTSLESLRLNGLFCEVESFSELFIHLAQLKDFALSFTKISDLNLISLPPLLESLCLRMSTFNEDKLPLKKMTNLKQLDLSNTKITGICLDSLSSLQILKLRRCTSLNEQLLIKVFKKLEGLEEIDLSETGISGECLTALHVKVRLVHMIGCKKLNENLLSNFLAQENRELHDLSLRLTLIKGTCLNAISADNKIKELDLGYCGKLEEDILSKAISKFHALNSLNLDRSISPQYTVFTGRFLQHIPLQVNQISFILYLFAQSQTYPQEIKRNIALFHSKRPGVALLLNEEAQSNQAT